MDVDAGGGQVVEPLLVAGTVPGAGGLVRGAQRTTHSEADGKVGMAVTLVTPSLCPLAPRHPRPLGH